MFSLGGSEYSVLSYLVTKLLLGLDAVIPPGRFLTDIQSCLIPKCSSISLDHHVMYVSCRSASL